jgi:hypothetical protein
MMCQLDVGLDEFEIKSWVFQNLIHESTEHLVVRIREAQRNENLC